MNDRHPAGDSFPADPGADYSYAGYDTGNYEQSAYDSYGTTGYATVTAGDGWSTGAYDTATTAAYQGGYDTVGHETGGYGTTGYDTGAYGTTGYDTGAYGLNAYETGSYETVGWNGQGIAETDASGLIPQQPGPHAVEQDWSTPAHGTAQWDRSAFETADWDGALYGQAHGHEAAAYETGGYSSDAYGPDAYTADVYVPDGYPTGAFEAVGYEANAYAAEAHATGAHAVTQAYAAEDFYVPDPYVAEAPDTSLLEAVYEGYEAHDFTDAESFATDPQAADPYAAEPGGKVDDGYEEPASTSVSEAESEPGAAALGPHSRGRRRSPKPRRSALLTVAAPSVAVLGVAGIAAASVLPAGDEESTQAAPDTEVKASPANSKLDTQLAGLREAGDDFADRASRTQERIDLKKRQEAERRRAAAEAARREALRQKYFLPVEGAGISAYFGQAGINWMSTHTGIDFPVSYGTPVKATTDGTIRTQWSYAYGNMLILTAPDGTETWYAHLGSYQYRSGSVKAGTVIAHSGNSGNSTGPHLHLEVRPGGGSPIDPLPWFRSHGLEPS